jgi:hypothetical protein
LRAGEFSDRFFMWMMSNLDVFGVSATTGGICLRRAG